MIERDDFDGGGGDSSVKPGGAMKEAMASSLPAYGGPSRVASMIGISNDNIRANREP